ncbi:MAG: AbrB/MazE/SpoVT family DNA-binding domain-containing protein [Armatimonadota bacterium]
MKVLAKGQVTIPAKIRHQLHLLPGTEVGFIIAGDAVTIVPMREEKTRERRIVDGMRGKGSVRLTTDEIMALTRGDMMPLVTA